MPKYRCDGFNRVTTDFACDAAKIFANRYARKKFGSKGYAYKVNSIGMMSDGSCYHYNAFVGYDSYGGCQGHNIQLFVSPDFT